MDEKRGQDEKFGVDFRLARFSDNACLLAE
jgi:hypothetical protein